MSKSSSPIGCTQFKLRKLDRMVSRHYDQFIGRTGLKITQFTLLSHAIQLEPVRQAVLANCLQLDASTLTRNLKPMVLQGWLSIGAGSDARSHLVTVTAEGRAKYEESREEWSNAQSDLSRRLGQKNAIALDALLDSCSGLLANGND